MASEFITRVEHGKDEPYTVIFRTDDADKYKHIEDECRRMIGHEKPTVDAVPVVRCQYCKWWKKYRNDNDWGLCEKHDIDHPCNCEWFCADGERRSNDNKT